MAANRRKQDDKNLEVLREIISQNGNKYCLDCNQRGPTYVNTTIGSFVCSKCSGMLRGLTPPHRVKSISMATFTPEEIEYIKARGNDYCRRLWLGLYEGESVNYNDEQSVKDFMSDKYEKKRYYLETASTTPCVNGNSSLKTKTLPKPGTSTSGATSLIPISRQTPKSYLNNNTFVQTANMLNNMTLPLINSSKAVPPPAAIPAPTSDFPVDFSTANIYNSSQFSNNENNNVASQSSISAPTFNAFSTTTAASNDRYAALADLDSAFRQQNIKHMEEYNAVNNKNPFQQNSTNSDLFVNKNPFFSGWSTPTTSIPVNPFMPTQNGGIINSKNPFL